MAPGLQNRARMKRPLLAAALAAAVPLAVVAAIATAPTGKVVDLDNYNASATASYINAAQCADTAPLNLEWSIVDANGGLTGTGKYKLYASDTAPSTTTSGTKVANFCPEADDTASSPQVHAGQLGSQVNWTSDIQGGEFSGSQAATLASADCTQDGDIIYICAHLYDDDDLEQEGLRERQVHRAGREARRADRGHGGDGRHAALRELDRERRVRGRSTTTSRRPRPRPAARPSFRAPRPARTRPSRGS